VLTSTGRSPGRSENRNKSYAFAQISASGRTSYDSTAVTCGLFGCLIEARSNEAKSIDGGVGDPGEVPLHAVNDASIV
jgi:hypothetical protein